MDLGLGGQGWFHGFGGFEAFVAGMLGERWIQGLLNGAASNGIKPKGIRCGLDWVRKV